MRPILLLISLALLLSANDASTFFKASQNNKVLCHHSLNGYMLLDHHNSKLIPLNNNTFFKVNKTNLYIPSSTCTPIKAPEGVTF